jgi:TRAP-type C4-dicarboxylate transport system permease small subunit
MSGYTKLCAALSRWSLRAAVLGLVVLVVCVQWQVIGRYLLNDSPTWTEPFALLLVLYITALLLVLGVPVAFSIGLASVATVLFSGMPMPSSSRRWWAACRCSRSWRSPSSCSPAS